MMIYYLNGYYQFDNIQKIVEGNLAIIYSAIWKDGPLRYDINQGEHVRKPNKRVTLKCLYNSSNCIDKFLKEV